MKRYRIFLPNPIPGALYVDVQGDFIDYVTAGVGYVLVKKGADIVAIAPAGSVVADITVVKAS